MTYARHEFTIDFVRVDPFEAVGVVVARVSMSTLFVTWLVAALEVVWHDRARTALPPEVS